MTMINENISKGKWTQLKGRMMKAWGKLTNDELDQTKGDVGKLVGLVQQRYGEAQEAVRDRINSFLKSLPNDDDAASENISSTETSTRAAGEIEADADDEESNALSSTTSSKREERREDGDRFKQNTM